MEELFLEFVADRTLDNVKKADFKTKNESLDLMKDKLESIVQKGGVFNNINIKPFTDSISKDIDQTYCLYFILDFPGVKSTKIYQSILDIFDKLKQVENKCVEMLKFISDNTMGKNIMYVATKHSRDLYLQFDEDYYNKSILGKYNCPYVHVYDKELHVNIQSQQQFEELVVNQIHKMDNGLRNLYKDIDNVQLNDKFKHRRLKGVFIDEKGNPILLMENVSEEHGSLFKMELLYIMLYYFEELKENPMTGIVNVSLDYVFEQFSRKYYESEVLKNTRAGEIMILADYCLKMDIKDTDKEQLSAEVKLTNETKQGVGVFIRPHTVDFYEDKNLFVINTLKLSKCVFHKPGDILSDTIIDEDECNRHILQLMELYRCYEVAHFISFNSNVKLNKSIIYRSVESEMDVVKNKYKFCEQIIPAVSLDYIDGKPMSGGINFASDTVNYNLLDVVTVGNTLYADFNGNTISLHDHITIYMNKDHKVPDKIDLKDFKYRGDGSGPDGGDHEKKIAIYFETFRRVGRFLQRDRATNSGSGTHGGGEQYKLFDKCGKRLATYNKEGIKIRD